MHTLRLPPKAGCRRTHLTAQLNSQQIKQMEQIGQRIKWIKRIIDVAESQLTSYGSRWTSEFQRSKRSESLFSNGMNHLVHTNGTNRMVHANGQVWLAVCRYDRWFDLAWPERS